MAGTNDIALYNRFILAQKIIQRTTLALMTQQEYPPHQEVGAITYLRALTILEAHQTEIWQAAHTIVNKTSTDELRNLIRLHDHIMLYAAHKLWSTQQPPTILPVAARIVQATPDRKMHDLFLRATCIRQLATARIGKEIARTFATN